MPFEVTRDFQLPNSNFYHKYSPFCVALSVLLFAYAISTPPKHELLKSFLLSSRAVCYGNLIDRHWSFATMSAGGPSCGLL